MYGCPLLPFHVSWTRSTPASTPHSARSPAVTESYKMICSKIFVVADDWQDFWDLQPGFSSQALARLIVGWGHRRCSCQILWYQHSLVMMMMIENINLIVLWVEWCYCFDSSRQLSTWCLRSVGNGFDRFDCQTLNKKLAKLWILWKLRGRLRILKPIFSISLVTFNTLLVFLCVWYSTQHQGHRKFWYWCCLSVAKPICNSFQGFGAWRPES